MMNTIKMPEPKSEDGSKLNNRTRARRQLAAHHQQACAGTKRTQRQLLLLLAQATRSQNCLLARAASPQTHHSGRSQRPLRGWYGMCSCGELPAR